jgi:hypothetical protein
MPVKRYSLKPSHGYDGGVTVIEDTDGGMVTYEDYRELIGLLEEARKDAARFNYLQNADPKRAQQFFWNYASRKQRAAAIDDAISARLKGGKE